MIKLSKHEAFFVGRGAHVVFYLAILAIAFLILAALLGLAKLVSILWSLFR